MMEQNNNNNNNNNKLSNTLPSSPLVQALMNLVNAGSLNAEVVRRAQEEKMRADAAIALLIRLQQEQQVRAEVMAREALIRSILQHQQQQQQQQQGITTLLQGTLTSSGAALLLNDTIKPLPSAPTSTSASAAAPSKDDEELVKRFQADNKNSVVLQHRSLQEEKSSSISVVHKSFSRAKHPKKRIQETIQSMNNNNNSKDPHYERRKYDSETFAEKLFRMCTDQEAVGKHDIVEFLEGGGGFWLHDEKRLVSELLPRYLRGRSFSSFRRQLVSYGFTKETRAGMTCGAFVNPLFSRGKPELCSRILRDTRYDRNRKQQQPNNRFAETYGSHRQLVGR